MFEEAINVQLPFTNDMRDKVFGKNMLHRLPFCEHQLNQATQELHDAFLAVQ